MANKSNKLKYNMLFETSIIILIACCVIFLNIFTTSKFSDLEESAHDAVFVMDEIQISEDDEFTEQIKDYLPDAYKMIELYDENVDLLFQIQFEKDNTYQHNDIKEYKNIMNTIMNTKEGQSRITYGNVEQDFYYKWIENSRGEMRLLVVYSKIKNVSNLWIFSAVCCLIMILVFILLIRLHMRQYHGSIAQYNKITDNVNSIFKS